MWHGRKVVEHMRASIPEMIIRTGLSCCPAVLYRPVLQDRAIFVFHVLSWPVLEKIRTGRQDRSGQEGFVLLKSIYEACVSKIYHLKIYVSDERSAFLVTQKRNRRLGFIFIPYTRYWWLASFWKFQSYRMSIGWEKYKYVSRTQLGVNRNLLFFWWIFFFSVLNNIIEFCLLY